MIEPNTQEARWHKVKLYQVRQGKCANCGKFKLRSDQLISIRTGKLLKYPCCDICRAKQNEYRSKAQRALRLEALAHYGGKCDCCEEARSEFLAIDHINGGGRKHRKEIGAYHIEAWLKKEGWPQGFRVLCHNCNMAFGLYSRCPHEIERHRAA